jgi:hypothetical protein
MGDFRFAIRAAREVASEIGELREQTQEPYHDERVRLLVVPARDEAEHVAAEILAGELDSAKWEVRVAGDEMLASELVAAVEEFRPAAVVFAALPPGGMSHCRYLVGRVRAKCPEARLIVGRWGCGEPTTPEPAAGIRGADAVDRSMAETRKRLSELHQVLVTETTKHPKPGAARVPVGTAGA